MRCVIKKCDSNSRYHSKRNGVTFHKIPKDPKRRNEWVKRINKLRKEYNWVPSKYSTICSKHFKSDDRIMPKPGKCLTKLKKDAAPNVDALFSTKMGQTSSIQPSRAACVGGSAAPPVGGAVSPAPLCFHAAHGDNVRLSRDCTVARRVEDFCKGVAFSARPVAVNEKVCIRFTEMSSNWSGVLHFGFTSHDPAVLAGALPKYVCPDLTNKPGHWAKALAERLCDRGSLLQYHVTHSGDVHFSVDGDDKGVFFQGVDTKTPLWALLDIYGNCTGIQFVDSRTQLNNATRRLEDSHSVDHSTSVSNVSLSESNSANSLIEEEIGRNLIPTLRAASINDAWRPVTFHRTCGRHMKLGPEPGVASRSRNEFCQGYAFTARPLAPNERLLIRILETESSYGGALALGLTSCDPARLTQRDLPDDSDMLLDRPEYWVVSKDVAGSLDVGEELVFSVSSTGEVKVALNGGAPVTVMHVDNTLRLWAFLDVYGYTRSVRVLSRPPPAVLVVALPPSNNQVPQPITSQPAPQPVPAQIHQAGLPQPSVQHQLQRALSPPASMHHAPTPQGLVHRTTSAGLLHEMQQAAILPGPANILGQPSSSSSSSSVIQPTSAIHQQMVYSVVGECTICYEQQIDSVLYTCGHMCMCYRCAVQQWRGKGGGQCPMCRAPIRDVIRTYKS